jgi:hydrogenase nickel incorporation protein HypB
MCETCGCGEPGQIHAHEHDHDGNKHSHEHSHEHFHDHEHPHDNDHPHVHKHSHEHRQPNTNVRKIQVETDILYANNLLAERNRGYFKAKKILAINLVSSPGSGKTTILERTIRELADAFPLFVIEGDQQTNLDAERIEKAGANAIQINTGTGCHLDSKMIQNVIDSCDLKENSILFIENVGNLVCPALFDLGESYRILIMSVAEGEDKPLKYPHMFRSSHLCIINKTDLLPYVDFSVVKARENALKVNPELNFFEISAKSGEGMKDWYGWLSHVNDFHTRKL